MLPIYSTSVHKDLSWLLSGMDCWFIVWCPSVHGLLLMPFIRTVLILLAALEQGKWKSQEVIVFLH